MIVQELREIPKKWKWVLLDDIICFLTDYQANGSFALLKKNVRKYDKKNYAVLVRLKDLRNSMKQSDDFVYTDKKGYDFLKKSSLKGGEILVANVGANVGTTLIMPKINQPATLAPNMYLVVPSKHVNKRYFAYYCKSSFYEGEIKRVSKGSGQPKINKKEYRSIFFPLAPSPEQSHIVARIERLFTQLDAGIKSLRKINMQLKRYRQAVLNHAFEGKLTEEWRKTHRDEIEPASVLLESIEEERKKNAKYKEPKPIDIGDLPTLPENWVWAEFGHICEPVEKVKPEEKPNEEFLYLEISSIDRKRNQIVRPRRILGKDAPSRARQVVRAGDILFSTVRTYLRNIAMVDEIYDGQIASTGFCVIRPSNSISKKWVFYVTLTGIFVNPLTHIQRGTSYPAIVYSDVFAQIVPLPPLPEQHRIVEELETRFSVVDVLESSVRQTLLQSKHLRQSILKEAFEGKLVSQDPTDEPAEKLLERIRKETEKSK